MRSKFFSRLLQAGGGVLLLLTAGASDMGALTFGQAALRLLFAALLLAAGTLVGRLRARSASGPRRRARRMAA